MIIHGTELKQLGNRRIGSEKCPYCSSNQFFIKGEVSYAHIYWIPLFPIKKKVKPVCNSCKMKISKKDLNKKTIDKIKFEKKNMSIPIYLFTGLFLISCAIAFILYANR